MDFTFRRRYPSVLDKDWAKLGYLPKQNTRLNIDLHPVFQQINAQRPKGHELIWPQCDSLQKYNTMVAELGPILQLASNILESPDSLDYLYQVGHSPRRISSSGQLSNKGHLCKEFGRAAITSMTVMRPWVKNILRNLAHSLSFQIGNPEASNVGGSIAITSPSFVGFMDGVKVNDVGGKSGVASMITINEEYLNMLRDLDNQPGDFTFQKMSLQLRIAISLCHEVAVSTMFNSSKLASGVT